MVEKFNQLEVRKLDSKSILDVHKLWEESDLSFRPDGRDTVERMESELRQQTGFLLGAFDEDRMVGVIMGTHDGRKGWLNRLAVTPKYRSRGIGRLLIAACEAELEKAGIGIICCLIEDWNEASLKLFQSEGYDLRRDILYLRKTPGGEEW